MISMLRVLVRRVATSSGAIFEGDTFRPERFDIPESTVEWLLATGRVEEVDDEVSCTIDDCDYSGTPRGLEQHTRLSHEEDS